MPAQASCGIHDARTLHTFMPDARSMPTLEVANDCDARRRSDAEHDGVDVGAQGALAGDERLVTRDVGAGDALPGLRREARQVVELVANGEAWVEGRQGAGPLGRAIRLCERRS